MSELKTTNPVRAVWALGDYDRFSRATVWQLGPRLVEACGVTAGQRLLDVATGTGNVALRAAARGASVVASDLTPEHFTAGRRAAAADGLTVEWVEGDAEQLPFDDSSFDVVTSCLGAMFAPDHQAVARELTRVCRRGGTIGLISFTPEGRGGAFFELLAPYLPPSPGPPPLAWGTEAHVRTLLGDRCQALALTRSTYIERGSSVEAYCALFMETFGPIVAIRAHLAHAPAQLADFDRTLRQAVIAWNGGRAGGPVAIPYEYLLAVGRTHPALDHR